MGHAIEISDFVAVRRRPDKTLRKKENRHTTNLCAYSHNLSGHLSGGAPARNPAPATQTEAPQKSSEYVKLGSQPSDQMAANNDIAYVEPESWIGTAPKNQLAIAVISCLALGTVVGYHWSSSVNQNHSINQVTSAAVDEPVVAPLAVEEPLLALADTTAAADNSARLEQEYLDEIGWLITQNSELKIEVEALRRETLAQNRELLDLEMGISALQSQSAPPTETRVIYNFVNVPIGGEIGKPTAQQELEVQQWEDQHLNDQAPNDSSVLIDQPIVEYQKYKDVYSDSNLTVDESEELLRQWQLERENYPVDSEVSYDPETGFYINPNYSYESDQPENAADADNSTTFPPLPALPVD